MVRVFPVVNSTDKYLFGACDVCHIHHTHIATSECRQGATVKLHSATLRTPVAEWLDGGMGADWTNPLTAPPGDTPCFYGILQSIMCPDEMLFSTNHFDRAVMYIVRKHYPVSELSVLWEILVS